MKYAGLIEKYREYLPVNKGTPVITLLEGNTPLIRSSYIGRMVGAQAYIRRTYKREIGRAHV